MTGTLAANSQRRSNASRHNGLSVLSARADPAGFDRILSDPVFAEIETYPQTNIFGRVYNPAIYGNHDRSFAIVDGGVPILLCQCSSDNGRLDFYRMPIRLVAGRGLDEDRRRAAVQSALWRLDEITRANGLSEAVVLDERAGLGSLIEEFCRARGATMDPHPVACVDLTLGPTAWRAALRKSSRSLINWGRRNLSIKYVNKETSDKALFDRYRQFHAEVAGRVTRSVESWDVMYEWMARGRGELILGFLADELVSGSAFMDGTEMSVYMVGVYDRTKFDKPLAHYSIWHGIERARERGMKVLELGVIPPQGAASDKEFQIGYFKRGCD